MKNGFSYFFLLSFLTLDACVDSFNIKSGDIQRYVVVDGLITDQPGPHTIRLYRSSPLERQQEEVPWIRGAKLTIRDDLGNSIALKETSYGNYATDKNFKGIAGRIYTLDIVISETEHFQSLPQELLPVGKMNKVYYEFKQVTGPETSLTTDPKNGFQIFVDAELLPEQEELMRWRTSSTFEVRTYPEIRMKEIAYPDRDHWIWVPDPPPCSGYIVRGAVPNQFTDHMYECTCCSCWPTVYDEIPVLSDPKFLSDDGQIHRHEILFAPADRRLFYKKCYFQVDQMSVTREAYDFWKGIQKQGGTSSDLFQTPGTKTNGNIKPVGETKTPVIGLFGVSSIISTSFFIDRSEIPYAMPPIDTVDQSCMTLFYRNNTLQRPPFW